MGSSARPYARAHNPTRLLDNYRGTRLYASVGNGQTPRDQPFNLISAVGSGLIESWAWFDTQWFGQRARRAGLDITVAAHSAGVHDWPFWRRELQSVIVATGCSGRRPAPRRSARRSGTRRWAPRQRLGPRLLVRRTTTTVTTFTRRGQLLSATGAAR